MSSPSDLRACDRCGRRRYVKNTRPNAALCGDCLDVEPGWPAVTIPTSPRPIARWTPAEAAAVIRALVQIAQRVGVEAQSKRTTCGACGCLVFTWERCPACALAAVGEVAA